MQAEQGYSITWEAPTSDGGSPITGYRLYADGVLVEDYGNAELSSIDSLVAGAVAEVSAVNAIGEGPKSAPVVVTDAPPSEPTPNPTPTNAYVEALNSQTLARLSGKDPVTDMFVYTNQDPYAPNFTRNPSCWINGVSNISCFSPAQLGGTSWFEKAGTLVTKKHIVYAKHYTINILPGGTPILFVDDDNNVVQRNLIDYRVDSATDIAVGLLDSEVSSNIKIAPILPTNYGDFFPSYPKSSDLFYVGLDKEEKAILKFGYIYGNASFLANNATGSYSQFSEGVVGGDSGNPVFIIVGDQLVLIGCWLWSTSGPFVTSRYSEINAMIEEMSPGEGYSLTSVELASPSSSSSSGSCGYQDCTGLSSDPVADCSETVVPPGYALYFDCELCECSITQVFPTGGSASSSASSDLSHSSSSTQVTFALTSQPSNITIEAGEGKYPLFSVTAVSPSPISYKWQMSNDSGANYYDINPNGGVFYESNTASLGLSAGAVDMSSTWNNARFRCVLESGGDTLVSGYGVLAVV